MEENQVVVTEEVATPQTETTNESTENIESVTEEVATPNEEKPVQSAEENAKFAEVRRKAEEKARQKAKQDYDSKIAKLFGDEYGINTVDDYLEAIEKQREQDRINKLVEQNIPEEYAKELIESKKFREQYENEKRQKQEESKRVEELKEFQTEYPDVKLDDIPREVFEQVGNGRTLLDAYSRYENKVLKDQLNQLKKLQENAKSSTGSVAGNGNVPDDFISEEAFQSNKSNMNWITKNYDKIMKSRAKW